MTAPFRSPNGLKMCNNRLHEMTPENTHVHPDGVRRKCLACMRANSARRKEKYRQEVAAGLRDPYRRTADKYRQSRLRKRGMTPAEFDGQLAEQGGKCAVCGNGNGSGRWNTFHIDHDHETGGRRGLLCNNCNMGLGHFKDDPDRLRAAADYIERHRIDARSHFKEMTRAAPRRDA